MNRDDEEEGEGERGQTTWRCSVLAEDDGVLPLVAVELVVGGRARRKKKKQRKKIYGGE